MTVESGTDRIVVNGTAYEVVDTGKNNPFIQEVLGVARLKAEPAHSTRISIKDQPPLQSAGTPSSSTTTTM